MYITKEQALDLINKHQAYLIDVRTPEEAKEFVIAEALHYPLEELEKLATENLDSSKPAVLFCVSGRRSKIGCKLLRFNGFAETYNLGSYKTWLET